MKVQRFQYAESGRMSCFAYRSTPFMKKGGVRMWTRTELKNRAKMCLSRYYWAAFAVSLIFAILSGFGGSNANTQRVTSYGAECDGKQPG